MAVQRICPLGTLENTGRLYCPTCQARARIEAMTAKQREPLVACLYLECVHAWHVTFDDTASDCSPVACDCVLPAALAEDGRAHRVRGGFDRR